METQYSGDTVILVFPDGTGPALLSCMIAGIPYNRVHELHYRPGEIRLNVNQKTTRDLFNSGQVLPENYKERLAEGRQELKRLRSIKPEDIVNVRDERAEKDRLEMEAGAIERAKKKEAKDKQDELARQARARQIEQEREKRLQQKASSGDVNDSAAIDSSTMIAASAAVGSLGAAALIVGDDKDEKSTDIINATASDCDSHTGPTDIAIEERPVVDILDAPLSTDADLSPSIVLPFGGGSNNVTDGHGDDDEYFPSTVIRQDRVKELVPVGGLEENATETMRVNGDRRATFPPPRKEQDRVKAAEDAMKEYMERDDGGSDWLLLMSDLMLEPDEDDKDGQPNELRP